MKLGIYARGLSEKSGGVKEYIESLTKELIKNIAKEDKLFIIHNNKQDFFSSNKSNVKEIKINSSNKLFCDFIKSPEIINSLKLDVCLFPKNVVPFGIKCKKILTIHDLAYYLPEYNAYPLLDTIYMRIMIKNSCKRADKIIAISKNTKKDIQDILKISENKIKVIYEAADSKYKKLNNKERLKQIKEKYRLPERFILFTGGISPRKNIIRLIKAFNVLAIKEKNIHLVITGSKEWNSSKEERLINSNKNIKKISFVEGKDMPRIYNLAEVYAYPSLYEGFGLPILEAQACGCPVLCSDTSSCPEVAGGSAHFVYPYSVKEIYNGMQKILENKRYKNTLIKKGYKNSKKFDWKKTAKETLGVMKNV